MGTPRWIVIACACACAWAVAAAPACGKAKGYEREPGVDRLTWKHRKEAKRLLLEVAMNLESYFGELGKFPPDPEPLTPAFSCCEKRDLYEDNTCAGSASYWSGPTWKSLHVEIDTAHSVRLAYDAVDPSREVVVRAVGDPQCDGTEDSYTLKATAEGGKVAFTFDERLDPF